MRNRVLDQDQRILDMLSYLLADSGFEVRAPRDQVFAMNDECTPDLLLVDFMPADPECRVICRKLKADPGHAKHAGDPDLWAARPGSFTASSRRAQ